MMPRVWHPSDIVAAALADAVGRGLLVRAGVRGRSWGRAECGRCGAEWIVPVDPASARHQARRIRRFTAAHLRHLPRPSDAAATGADEGSR